MSGIYNSLSLSLSLVLPSSLLCSRVHAVCVCDNADYFHGHIDETLEELGLLQSQDSQRGAAMKSRDIIDIIEGYKGRGYGLSTDEELGEFSSQYFLCS